MESSSYFFFCFAIAQFALSNMEETDNLQKEGTMAQNTEIIVVDTTDYLIEVEVPEELQIGR